MDSKKFLLAMNELDDRMILKAERYGARRVAWVQFWDEAGAWAASIAALAVMLLLVLGLNYTGLLRDSDPLSAPAAESRESCFESASSRAISSVSDTAINSSAWGTAEIEQPLVFSDKPFLEQTNDIAMPEGGFTIDYSGELLASIFGRTGDFIWNGVNVTEWLDSHGGSPFGRVVYDGEQNVHRAIIWLQEPFYMELDFAPNALPPTCIPNDFQPNQVIFGAEVDARKIDLGDGTVRYEVRFVREGGENGETIGVRAVFENKGENSSEKEIEYYVNLFARQALDPEQTLQLSQLSRNFPIEASHGVIAKDGTITYENIFTQQAYELYMHTEAFQTETLPYEGQRVKIVVPDIYYTKGRLASGRARRLLFVLLKEEYLVYEQDGTWYVALNNAYCDLAGYNVTEENWLRGPELSQFDFWLPSDGSQYFPSILEFCESIVWGNQNAQEIAEGAVEHLSARSAILQETARQLLEDYLAENGITEYEFLS